MPSYISAEVHTTGASFPFAVSSTSQLDSKQLPELSPPQYICSAATTMAGLAMDAPHFMAEKHIHIIIIVCMEGVESNFFTHSIAMFNQLAYWELQYSVWWWYLPILTEPHQQKSSLFLWK